jgi:hypothetical protein
MVRDAARGEDRGIDTAGTLSGGVPDERHHHP